jgi:hypothetical protein
VAGAAQLCQVALRRDKRNVAALFLLALTHMQERKPDDAELQFAKATRLDVTVAEILANRGNNQIAHGNPTRALEFLLENPLCSICHITDSCSAIAPMPPGRRAARQRSAKAKGLAGAS